MSKSARLNSVTANEDTFAAWAAVYDEQENPLLTLEERILSPLLPNVSGRNVIDIGCGTGRWLSRFSHTQAASVCGLDGSSEMLEIAAGKHLQNAKLLRAALPSIPMESASADLTIASFVLSYVADLVTCASELARVSQPGGDLFISDMHPATAAALGWTRGFCCAGQTYQLKVQNHAIRDVIDILVRSGFSFVACLEPQFGKTEYDVLRRHGKESAWKTAEGMPAIYVLHFRRQ